MQADLCNLIVGVLQKYPRLSYFQVSSCGGCSFFTNRAGLPRHTVSSVPHIRPAVTGAFVATEIKNDIA